MDVPPEAAAEPASITIKTLSGETVLQVDSVPANVAELKHLIADSGYMPYALQKILHENGFAVCADEETLEAKTQGMILVRDETPLWYWDLEGNPSRESLDIEGGVVKCPRLPTDYTNIVTREPISAGLHYFEFHLHHYGDEQWCGLTPDKTLAGPDYQNAIPSKTGWCYYTGRGKGALEALGRHLKETEFVERSNSSIIGMLVDCGQGAAAFDLNGAIQGACEIPKNTPLWIVTHVDTRRDHVELRKPSLEDAAPVNFEALKGALLDVREGTVMTRNY
mmetsp:Transcript_137106/g.273460  ORF Transcript_137106/g.273460 Transcript_137106/m.273460 type:complete len:279 (+) Transcript_137106:50-886(+)